MYFINKPFDLMINNYINNSFSDTDILKYFFESLIVIYGEMDLINPYKLEKEELLIENLTKYGYSKKQVSSFFTLLHNFYLKEENNIKPNIYFVPIQKALIDMYMLKRKIKYLDEIDLEVFKNTLFLPNSSDEFLISVNFLHSLGSECEIEKYFNSLARVKPKREVKKLLTPEAYRIVGLDYTMVNLLSGDDIDKINDSVYERLNVKKSAINSDYLFEEALKDYFKKDEKLTSGNGYVDILLIMSTIATVVMAVMVAVTWIM